MLSSLSLFLPAGATIAVVGEDGSGKTTLVKLLLGMYQPTSGAIAVRMADLIVYLEDGHAVESGTHDALMASGGRYAELFTLQAAGYK